jgi:hypothetical protein
MSHGEARAKEFLAALAFEDAWRSRDPDVVMTFFAEDAELVSSAPFPEREPYRGRAQIRSFVTEYLAEKDHMDLTKKQVARNRVTWTVRAIRGNKLAIRVEGLVEAEFRVGKMEALHLSTGTRAGSVTSIPYLPVQKISASLGGDASPRKLRLGHNSSSGSEEGFESTIDLRLALVTVQQSQLVDKNRSKSEAGGVERALGGNLLLHLEDGLEMLIEVLIGQATQLVKDPPHLYS